MNEITLQLILFTLGVIVAVISYLAKNFVFQPLLEFRATVGKIQNRLKYHANKMFNSVTDEVAREVGEELRQLSCDLEEKYYAIAFHGHLYKYLGMPSPEHISEAGKNLIYLANSVGDADEREHKHQTLVELKEALGLLIDI